MAPKPQHSPTETSAGLNPAKAKLLSSENFQRFLAFPGSQENPVEVAVKAALILGLSLQNKTQH